MNLTELERALRQLRLGGMATVLETHLRQAQTESMAPIDLISCLVSDELTRRGDRLLERRRKQACFRDPQKTFDNFDFTFNPKMNRGMVFDLGTFRGQTGRRPERQVREETLMIQLPLCWNEEPIPMARVPHQSSVLAATEYCPICQTLDVVFTSGELYRYSEVPPSVYHCLLEADSKGTFFNSHIRNLFPYQYLGRSKNVPRRRQLKTK